METIWDAGTRSALEQRLGQLRPDSRPSWGRMNVIGMLAHCAGAMEMALGERAVRPKPGPFRNALARYLVIYLMPWPKGAPTAPELLFAEPGEFEANRRNLLAALDRMVARRGQGFADHAAFGKLSDKDWGCLTWRHLDHHFRQFGV